MGQQPKLPASSVLEAFYQRERLHPDRVYMLQPLADGHVEQYTWAQVGDQARRIASYLRSLALPAGSNVSLLGHNCAHWIIADLAIWMSGHVSVPLYPDLSAASTLQLLEHSESRAVFVGPVDQWETLRGSLPDDLPCIGLPTLNDSRLLGWASLLASHQPLQEVSLPGPEQLATVIYTSGTSGPPKGVMLSFASMFFAANNGLRLFNITERDRLLSHLPLSHVAERQFIEIASILAGQTLYFTVAQDTLLQDLQRARPTVFLAVPHLWQRLQREAGASLSPRWLEALVKLPVIGKQVACRILAGMGLDQIRYAVSGGAPASSNLLTWYQGLGLKLVEVYGMTENCGYSHLGRPARFKSGWIGLPNPGVECRLSAESELLVHSQANMLGYFKDAGKTAEVLDDEGFLHTGDLAEIDNEGFLRLTGRLRDNFKTSRGKYVVPAPIESLLLDHEHIEHACVLGSNLLQPLALIRLSAAGQIAAQQPEQLDNTLNSLLAQTNEGLARHEQLGCLVVIQDNWNADNGFMTPLQKIRRNVVEATYIDHLDIWSVSGKSVVWQ